MHAKGRNPLIGLFALVFVCAVGFAALGYAMGWIEFTNEPDRSTIEIDKTELKSDADEAKRAADELIEETGESLRKAGEALSADESKQ